MHRRRQEWLAEPAAGCHRFDAVVDAGPWLPLPRWTLVAVVTRRATNSYPFSLAICSEYHDSECTGTLLRRL